MGQVTELLAAAQRGDEAATDRLLPAVYDELRRLAAARLAHERAGHTLQPTALVHEAYLRLVGSEDSAGWDSRGHFFAAAAEAMRRILVDSARAKLSLKRGGDRRRQELVDDLAVDPGRSEDLLALDEALQRLEQQDQRKAQLVKLRYFAGLTSAEAAQTLGVSLATAERDWAFARAWLHRAITRGESTAGG